MEKSVLVTFLKGLGAENIAEYPKEITARLTDEISLETLKNLWGS